jgi:hypothetical protein
LRLAIHDRTNVPASHGAARFSFFWVRFWRFSVSYIVREGFRVVRRRAKFPCWVFSDFSFLNSGGGNCLPKEPGKLVEVAKSGCWLFTAFDLSCYWGDKRLAQGGAMIDSLYQRSPALLLCTYRKSMTHAFTTSLPSKRSTRLIVSLSLSFSNRLWRVCRKRRRHGWWRLRCCAAAWGRVELANPWHVTPGRVAVWCSSSTKRYSLKTRDLSSARYHSVFVLPRMVTG